MSIKNKDKVRLTESQLKKLIIHEMVPGVVASGTDSGAGDDTGREKKKQAAKKGKELVYIRTGEKLKFEILSEPDLLTTVKDYGKAFFQKYKFGLENLTKQMVPLPNELMNLIYDVTPDAGEAEVLQRYNDKVRKNKELKAFEGLIVRAVYDGNLVVGVDQIEQIAKAAVYLLADPVVPQNVYDIGRIVRLLGGNVNDVKAALGRSGAGEWWENFKRDYGDGLIQVINTATKAKIRSGKLRQWQAGPICATDDVNIYDGLEYFKSVFNEESRTAYWTVQGKPVKDHMAAMKIPNPFYYLPFGGIGNKNFQLETLEYFKYRYVITSTSSQSVVGRGDLLVRRSARVSAALNAYITSATELDNPGLDELRALVDVTKKTARAAESIIIRRQNELGIGSPRSGNRTPIASALNYNPGAMEESLKRRGKSLLTEVSTPLASISDWVDQLSAGQQTVGAGTQTRDYTVGGGNNEDKAVLWLGPNPDAKPFIDEKITWWGGAQRKLISKFLQQVMLIPANRDKIGANLIEDSAPKVVTFPNPANIAFFFLQVDDTGTGRGSQWINPFAIPSFREELIEVFENKFPSTEFTYRLGDPKDFQQEKEEKNNCPEDKRNFVISSLNTEVKRTKKFQEILNAYITHHNIGSTISVDGDWGDLTTDAFERVVKHGLNSDPAQGLNHPVFGPLNLSQSAIDAIASDWGPNAKRLNKSGYVNSNKQDVGDITGALAFIHDLYNCNDEYGKDNIKRPPKSKSVPKKGKPKTPGRKEPAEETDSAPSTPKKAENKCDDGSTIKKATWRDIQIQFNQKSKKFALDPAAVDQLKVDLAKQTAAFVVNPSHKMNPVKKEHVGTFTIGIGGRIKNRKSHDWNVPKAYERIIDKAMKNLIQKAKKSSKGLNVVRNSNIIITIPCGNYTTLSESIRQKREKDFEDVLRELIRGI